MAWIGSCPQSRRAGSGGEEGGGRGREGGASPGRRQVLLTASSKIFEAPAQATGQ